MKIFKKIIKNLLIFFLILINNFRIAEKENKNEMKKTSLFIFIIILVLTFMIIISTPVNSYPGDGDCNNEHPIVKIKIPMDENANLILDGNLTEPFWENPNNSDGKIRIPLANEAHIVIYLNATFIMNKTHIFISCQWLDGSTTPPPAGDFRDALLFCWNINWPGFSAYFPYGMKTDIPDTYFDSWLWNCNEDSVTTVDTCYGFGGELGFEDQDLETSWTNISDHSYTVEMIRKLETGDNYDFQINEKKLYKFNVGILDDDKGIDHYVSYTYALDLSEPIVSDGNNCNDDDSSENAELNVIFLIIILSIITISILSFIYFYYKKNTLKR